MTTPTGRQIAVALDALHSDARVWASAVGDLNAPKDSAHGLTLRPADVSGFAAKVGLDSTYNEALADMQDVLTQATQNFHNLADALNSAAAIYQREDEQGMHRLKGIY